MNREGPLCAGAEWARFKGHVYRDLCRGFIISQCCTFTILSHHLLFAHLLVSFCAYSHINRAPRVRPRSHLKGEATGAYAIRLLHVCPDLAFSFKKKKGGGQALGVKKKETGRRGGGAVRRQKYASVLRASKVSRARLLPVVGGEGVLTCQRVRGLAEWLHITLSAPATSHLYCNANPWPVPDGAFPASWVHRNMIIYPEHF